MARGTYARYRRTQAAALLDLLPPDAVRPLYRRAREWAVARGNHDAKDPRATLLRYCEHILPLPPYRKWLHDASRHPGAHARHLERRWSSDGTVEPVPADVRSFARGETVWHATLNLYRTEGAWRGFVSFHRGPDGPVHRTAEIFREETAGAVRSRFRSFDSAALSAFLRSVRP